MENISCDVDFTITKTNNIKKFSIHNINVKLFESVSMNVLLFNENDVVVDGRYLVMDNADYAQWANDDNYLLEWVKSKITFSNS